MQLSWTLVRRARQAVQRKIAAADYATPETSLVYAKGVLPSGGPCITGWAAQPKIALHAKGCEFRASPSQKTVRPNFPHPTAKSVSRGRTCFQKLGAITIGINAKFSKQNYA